MESTTNSTAAGPVTQSPGKLYNGRTVFKGSRTGSLTLSGNQLSFTDNTNNPVLSLTPDQVQTVTVGAASLIINSGGKRYTFVPDGAKKVTGSLAVGGLGGLMMASKANQTIGMPQWFSALQTAGYQITDHSLKKGMRWGLMLGLGLVFLFIVLPILYGLVQYAFRH